MFFNFIVCNSKIYKRIADGEEKVNVEKINLTLLKLTMCIKLLVNRSMTTRRRRGLNLDENLIIIASPDDRKIQKRKFTKSAIEMRQKSDNANWHTLSKSDKNVKRTEQQMVSRSSIGHWKTVLLKYHEKYGQNISANEIAQPFPDSLKLALPQGHCTPLANEMTNKLVDEHIKCELVEKPCQTTLPMQKTIREQSDRLNLLVFKSVRTKHFSFERSVDIKYSIFQS